MHTDPFMDFLERECPPPALPERGGMGDVQEEYECVEAAERKWCEENDEEWCTYTSDKVADAAMDAIYKQGA